MAATMSRPTASSRRVSTELRDATSTLLHIALIPHHHPPATAPSTATLHHRKSVEVLRVPPALSQPASSREGTSSDPATGSRRRQGRSSVPGESSNESFFNPFADNGGLLRRCTSEIDLDLPDETDDESDFASDVRTFFPRVQMSIRNSISCWWNKEEPFRLRPPSVRSVSSVASKSSSVSRRVSLGFPSRIGLPKG